MEKVCFVVNACDSFSFFNRNKVAEHNWVCYVKCEERKKTTHIYMEVYVKKSHISKCCVTVPEKGSAYLTWDSFMSIGAMSHE